MKKNQCFKLVPIKIEDCENNGLYVVEAKKNRQFPKLGRTPYWVHYFQFKDLTIKSIFAGSSIHLNLDEVRAVWKVEPL